MFLIIQEFIEAIGTLGKNLPKSLDWINSVIGKVSNTAIGEIKDEPHLHFTLFKDNNNVDPTYIFK